MWSRGNHRGLGRLLVAGLTVLAVLVLASGALADAGHDFAFSFSGAGANSLGVPTDAAVDNSSGPSAHDVYVTDPQENRIQKFDPSGNFILMFGDGVNLTTGGDVCSAGSGDVCGPGLAAPATGGMAGAFDSPVFVAVDSSGGPSAGDVYVADWETGEVSKFSSSGELIPSWGTGGAIAVPEQIGGIAVGSDGRLFVQSGTFPATILVYGEGGGPLASFGLSSGSNSYGIALDSSDNLYALSGAWIVEKYTATGVDLGEIDGAGSARGLAVDPSGDDLYVRHSESIARFPGHCSPPNCEPIATFGEGFLGTDSALDGLSVDSSTEAVYAVNFDYQTGGRVLVFFPPGVLPQVTTGGSSALGETGATVAGDIDPAGTGNITDCRFEYVSEPELRAQGYGAAESAPCSPSPPFSALTNVSADLSDLQPGTTYQYRLVAVDAERAAFGTDRVFATTSLPEVITGTSTNVRLTSASVIGLIRPATGATVGSCDFEYVNEVEFEDTGYEAARSTPCSPPPPYTSPTIVTADLSPLLPGTTYDYRVVAANTIGRTVTGVDGNLTTPISHDSPIVEPPVPKEEGEEEAEERQPHVVCAKHACTRELEAVRHPRTWVSPGFPPGYGWVANVYAQGSALPHGHLVGGCVVTFRGFGLVVRLNGCHRHIKLRYYGTGRFRFRWIVH